MLRSVQDCVVVQALVSIRADLHLVCLDSCIWSEALHSLCCDLRFALSDVVFAEQELSVQIAGLNRVHVNLHIPVYLACLKIVSVARDKKGHKCHTT